MTTDSDEQSANIFYAMGDNGDDDSSLNVFDSVAVDSSSSYVAEYDWSNSSFFTTSMQLKSKDNDALLLTDERFDINHVDPSCAFSAADDYYHLQTLTEFERESIIAERMEIIRNQHLMSMALKQAAKLSQKDENTLLSHGDEKTVWQKSKTGMSQEDVDTEVCTNASLEAVTVPNVALVLDKGEDALTSNAPPTDAVMGDEAVVEGAGDVPPTDALLGDDAVVEQRAVVPPNDLAIDHTLITID
jgi:hypothetical protein